MLPARQFTGGLAYRETDAAQGERFDNFKERIIRRNMNVVAVPDKNAKTTMK